ncbi:hypothetical protein GCM10027589_33920 [Actinocorallia lasiicapitis]
MAAVESTVAAGVGTVVGFGLFVVVRPVLAGLDLSGTRFFTSDLSLGLVDVLVVAVGVPVGAAVAALVALRRVRISPLGVARRVRPGRPRAWRLVPLVVGLGELAFFVGRVPEGTGGQLLAFGSGALTVLAGLVVAGPWLTMAAARLVARRTGRPAVLIAGRRIADDPKAAFRAVSGLVLTLCITSGSVGVISAMTLDRGVPAPSAAAGDAVVARIAVESGPDAVVAGRVVPAGLAGELAAVPGVAGVAVIRVDPRGAPDPAWGEEGLYGPARPGGLVSCAELAAMPVFHRCPAGAAVVSVTPDFTTLGRQGMSAWPEVWPAAAVSVAEAGRLPARQIVVATDGSRSAVERVRTLLAGAFPGALSPVTIAEDRAWSMRELAGYQRLVSTMLLLGFPIAGCGLAVGAAAGVADRRRPFALLRLTGTPLGVLRRVVVLETVVPLLVVAVVAVGTGLLAAHLFLEAQFDRALPAPSVAFWLLLVAGLASSLVVLAPTLPLLDRLTRLRTTRTD